MTFSPSALVLVSTGNLRWSTKLECQRPRRSKPCLTCCLVSVHTVSNICRHYFSVNSRSRPQLGSIARKPGFSFCDASFPPQTSGRMNQIQTHTHTHALSFLCVCVSVIQYRTHRRQNGRKASKYKIVLLSGPRLAQEDLVSVFSLWADMPGICSPGERMK